MKKMNDVLQRKVLCALLAVAAMGVSVNVQAGTFYSTGNSAFQFVSSKTSNKDIKRKEIVNTENEFAGMQISKRIYNATPVTVNLRGNVDIDVENTGSAPALAKGITAGIYSTIPKSVKAGAKITSTLGAEGSSSVKVKAKGNQYVSGIQLLGQSGYHGPQMTINGKELNVSAESTGNYAHGIYVANTTSDLGGKDTTKLVINSENTVIHAKTDTKEHEIGIATYSQGQVEVNGNLEVNAANAIVTRGGSTIFHQ